MGAEAQAPANQQTWINQKVYWTQAFDEQCGIRQLTRGGFVPHAYAAVANEMTEHMQSSYGSGTKEQYYQEARQCQILVEMNKTFQADA